MRLATTGFREHATPCQLAALFLRALSSVACHHLPCWSARWTGCGSPSRTRSSWSALVLPFLLAFGTLVAVTFWIAADDARFLKLVVGLWGVYGFTVGVVDGLLTPLVDGAARALQGFGARVTPDFASVEALVAGGHHELRGASRYREHAGRSCPRRAG